MAWAGMSPAPPSPFNGPIGPHRRYTWVDAELAELKAVKHALGGTLNDAVLAAKQANVHGKHPDLESKWDLAGSRLPDHSVTIVQGPEPALVAPRLEDERGGEIVQQLRLEQHEPTPVGRAQQVHEAV